VATRHEKKPCPTKNNRTHLTPTGLLMEGRYSQWQICPEVRASFVPGGVQSIQPHRGRSLPNAVPGDELIDGVLVHAARGGRAEAVEHGQFAMIQIRKAKHPATVIRFISVCPERRPSMPQDWNYGRPPGRCKYRY